MCSPRSRRGRKPRRGANKAESASARSAGTNDLLRQGAAPLTSVRDVLEAIGIDPEPPRPPFVSEAAQALLALLADGARAADELTRLAQRSSGEVAAALMELELAGLAAQTDGIYRTFSPGRSRVARASA
jgi:predicted Rossmann fold nucleotide-binding protein DprA/Smf involved in DNA uptake